MKEIKASSPSFQAGVFQNPDDPVNSAWAFLVNPEADSDYEGENFVTGGTYEECLKLAIEATLGDMGGVVIARVEVSYLIPSDEEIYGG